MKRFMLAASAALMTMVSASPAFAARFFNLQATSANFTISALLTTTNQDDRVGYNGNVGYRITDISGTINNNTITGLVAPGGYPTQAVANDNILKSSAPYFDVAGVSFTTSGGASPFNLFYEGDYFFIRGAAENNAGTITSLSVTPSVPEPATWAMMIVGMGAVGYSLRSAKRRSDVRFNARIKRIAAGLEA